MWCITIYPFRITYYIIKARACTYTQVRRNSTNLSRHNNSVPRLSERFRIPAKLLSVYRRSRALARGDFIYARRFNETYTSRYSFFTRVPSILLPFLFVLANSRKYSIIVCQLFGGISVLLLLFGEIAETERQSIRNMRESAF